MPVWPLAAYTAAMIGLIVRLAQPTAICFGEAGLVRGPSTLNTHGTPSAARTGPTKRMAGWNVRAKANAMPHSLPTSAHLFRCQIERQAQRLEAVSSAALGRGRTIAVLDDFRYGCGSHHRAHGRQVHRGGTVATGTDDVGGFTVDVQRMAWDTMAFAAPRTSSGVKPQAAAGWPVPRQRPPDQRCRS